MKETKSKSFLSVPVSNELKQKIKELANKKEISINGLVRMAIVELIEKEKNE